MVPSSRVVESARRILLVVVVGAVALALWSNWDQVEPHLRAISGQAWIAAAGAALLAPLLTLLGWRRVLADLGSPLPIGQSTAVFLVGQLGKYVPGSVWAIVAQTEMAARFGVPRRRAGVAGMVAVAMSLLTGAVMGVPAVLAIVNAEQVVILGFVAVACVVLAISLYPPVLNRAVTKALRMLRRPPLEHELSGRAVVSIALWYLLAWLAAGASAAVLARDLAPQVENPAAFFLVCVSGLAAATSVGMLSVILPAGVGVREAVLLILLAGFMTLPAATAVAILVRFLTIIADITWAVVGWLWGRR